MKNKERFFKKEKEIIGWLKKYNIKNYTLIPNNKYGFVVDVNDDVKLYNKDLKFIPVKFNIVSGYFDCSNNKIISLQGCPKTVNSNFYCFNNPIQNYIYFPEKIGNNIWLNDDKEYTFEEAYKIHLKDKAEYEKQLLIESIKTIDKVDNNNFSYKI